ncbi:hypothetical protein [Zavarzinella formosa]|uniref:hypothetical protein n=1 Tax=Zavarzinella formosa TaxID=360055 RepID=UPI00036220E4|nr:hypothetical protein [Zavarzinella formosa]
MTMEEEKALGNPTTPTDDELDELVELVEICRRIRAGERVTFVLDGGKWVEQ